MGDKKSFRGTVDAAAMFISSAGPEARPESSPPPAVQPAADIAQIPAPAKAEEPAMNTPPPEPRPARVQTKPEPAPVRPSRRDRESKTRSLHLLVRPSLFAILEARADQEDTSINAIANRILETGLRGN